MKSKIIKRAAMVCAAAVYMLLVCFAMTGCWEPPKPLTTEDFEYHIYTDEYSDGTEYEYVAITGLTEVGKTKEVIIFPREVDGLPVDGFYQLHVIGKWWHIDSNALKKVYLPGGGSRNQPVCRVSKSGKNNLLRIHVPSSCYSMGNTREYNGKSLYKKCRI